jgi:Family of unknown function (DUF6174)/Domain of unknown function (DUF6438)
MRSPLNITIGLLLSLGITTQILLPSEALKSQSVNNTFVKLNKINVDNKSPDNKNSQKFQPTVITLERTPCFGACPTYKLTITGDGKGDAKVIYEGIDFVKVKGKRSTKISANKFKQLFSEFQKVNYLSLKDNYQGGLTDLPSAITSITVGKKQKKVNHYQGSPEAPKNLTDLENKIDSIVNTRQWIEGKKEAPKDKTSLELIKNRQIWNRKNFNTYSYVFTRSCFCAPKSTEPITIEFRNGNINYISSGGTPVQKELFERYNSIPKLFDVIQDAIDNKAAKVNVKYHPTLGYPTDISLDYKAQVADDELFIKVRDLQAIN